MVEERRRELLVCIDIWTYSWKYVCLFVDSHMCVIVRKLRNRIIIFRYTSPNGRYDKTEWMGLLTAAMNIIYMQDILRLNGEYFNVLMMHVCKHHFSISFLLLSVSLQMFINQTNIYRNDIVRISYVELTVCVRTRVSNEFTARKLYRFYSLPLSKV